ncbi:GH92 family glycosyl hydrolase [Paraliomyxa miuraensis]|uniref:GH92 family glycosyl hydrolase n=1 Tax=Paraliomyxa miuraensis TaxID=376150 RepID=UPI00225BC605|nr:GH92 family glycosyl hydrolase [Paraliomyxa miuraensis]MCX4246302.1 GH92 family glycosyl hydrolase [Paraliomyxa miuraensis]
MKRCTRNARTDTQPRTVLAWVVLALAGCHHDAPPASGHDASDSGSTGDPIATTDDTSTGVADSSTGDAEEPWSWPPEVLASWVDPRIGTGGTGYGVGTTNPGPSVPFGMVKLGPDTGLGPVQLSFTNCTGYSYGDTHVWGFSHSRLNGMGVPDYGAVLVTPTIGMAPGKALPGGARSSFSHDTEDVAVGYYAVDLADPGIRAELTGGMWGGHHRYTWNEATDEATVVIDLGYNPAGASSTAGRVEIDPESGRVRGFMTVDGSYSSRFGGLRTYFEIRPSEPIVGFGVWDEGRTLHEGVSLQSGSTIGAWLRFSPPPEAPTVELRVGLSYLSMEQAAANLEASLSGSFEQTRDAAVAAWETELSRVRVAGGTDDERTMLYTALYHAWLAPTQLTEANGRYRGFDGGIHDAGNDVYYSDFSLWDTYRSLHPLLSFVQRDRHGDMMQSLVRMYEQGGDLPKWPLGTGYTGGMVGTSADIVLAEAMLKGIDFDHERAYEGARLHATEPRPNAGRAGIEGYLARGYVAVEEAGSSVSRTLEFAWADAALARMAERLGRADDQAMFEAHAAGYLGLWDETEQFFVGHHADGSPALEGFDPTEWAGPYAEGDAWQYLWMVPDVEGLVALHGSRQATRDRLLEYFELSTEQSQSPLQPKPYYWHSNEPVLHDAYLFNDLGDPASAQRWARWAMAQNYGTGPDGLPGNDDAGTMSAWYVLSAVGLYPVPGTERIWIGSPVFERAELDLSDATGSRSLTVIADGAGPGAIYVTGAELDGAALERPWVWWSEIEQGATLRLTMSDTPGSWGRN